ncbi:insulinase family protein [Bariatricus massiliensis]|uniref:Insulinase family protein n=1 Tax=Bariatricus massiliensis TaxID=1745713 RepID=A0ABS8DED4_9FIRM|nr:insulinase family protein [Bariatricus massiliensis]MCB7302894.1 insulinase family protein [Bariatricus massiliensis]MCB7374110.1 insulinase family protein [Bariatricus massiliensis]MCB7386780.1 insulinase family protein [Bariatricus massiliensis]MCB7410942.1 insulinase family protein [Bariatricus massiliensis]MCQ5251768.1 insulinase family protein [Bariatricus massiliensis]
MSISTKKQQAEQAAAKYGFTVEKRRELTELKAILWEMCYEKNGARVLWLEREEENQTFAAAFKTIPCDDTGVFHILEHSVLCGSEKYPVSKPFVELIKSSLQTFINAFTFPDKTVYPVSSRNRQDFLNLMDVYLDAVLHPLCVSKEEIFRQEGWHYELTEGAEELTLNGVVYNEMKGVYASPDTLIDSELNKRLFPDNCYRFQSGGAPEAIPQLSYEQYTAAHRKFYHPSNAWFILDGDVDIEAVLEKIGGAVSGYDRQETDAGIPMQSPVSPGIQRITYEIGEGEDGVSRMLLAKGWVYGRFDEPEKVLACRALGQMLCSSNDAPLKKALLENGLAADVEFSERGSILQPCAFLVVRNTTPEKEKEVWDTVQRTLEELAEGGLEHERLKAVLQRMRFMEKEKEAGGFTPGISNVLKMLDSCLYGGDPAQQLCLEQPVSDLIHKVEEGYFEKFIRENLLENNHCASVALEPSAMVGKENRERERRRLEEVKKGWTDREKEQVIQELVRLRQKQMTPDAGEKLATLPTLSLSDIPEERDTIPQIVKEMEGRKVLYHPLETEGIVHIAYYFSLEDMTPEELHALTFLQTLLGQTETEHFDTLSLQAELDANLGRFQTGTDVFDVKGNLNLCNPYFAVYVSVLQEKLEDAVRMTDEVLNHSVFHNSSYIYNRIRQFAISMENHVLMYGDSYGSMQAAAGFSAPGAAKEAMRGISMLRWLKQKEKNFAEEGEELVQELERLCRRVFVKARVTLSVTGHISGQWTSKLLSVLPDGKAPGQRPEYALSGPAKRGLLIPAQIGFAVKGGHLGMLGAKRNGAMLVAAKILSYGYLWDNIRIRGGAYGTRLSVSQTGEVMFTSFRDPDAAASLNVYDGAGAALRKLCESGEKIERYLISAVASIEPLLSLRQKGMQAAENYLAGVTEGMRQKEKKEILHTTKEELEQASILLDKICAEAAVCVLAGAEALDAAHILPDERESL